MSPQAREGRLVELAAMHRQPRATPRATTAQYQPIAREPRGCNLEPLAVDVETIARERDVLGPLPCAGECRRARRDREHDHRYDQAFETEAMRRDTQQSDAEECRDRDWRREVAKARPMDQRLEDPSPSRAFAATIRATISVSRGSSGSALPESHAQMSWSSHESRSA